MNDPSPKSTFFFPKIHLSYVVPGVTPQDPMKLRYASGSFGNLALETIDLVNYGDGRSSLALDDDFNPHISYMKKDAQGFTLRHAQPAKGSGWVTEVASRHRVHPAKENAIAVEATGRVGVSHWRDDSVPPPGQTQPPFNGTRELLVSSRPKKIWDDHLRPVWNIGNHHATLPMLDTSLAYDSSDRGHLAYVRTLSDPTTLHTSGLYYTFESKGKVWNQPIAPLAVPSPTSKLISVSHAQIALDSSDHYHIIYTTWERATTVPTKCFLRYLTNANDAPADAGLIAELSEDFGAPGGPSTLAICEFPPTYRPAIAIDPIGNVHVAYYDNGIVDKEQGATKGLLINPGLWYARRKPGGNWEREFVDARGALSDVSIAVSQTGEVIIAYGVREGEVLKLKLALRIGGWRYDGPLETLTKLGDIAVFGSRGRSNIRRVTPVP